ncbi:hypothetical protein QYF36_027065 [Acer negundo]|nr:hypothetical protein QYF36_027065 [Acer negundo]
MEKQVMHVVMLPWSAFGHLMPFFQLSIALAKSGFKVSFVSTPKNIQRLPKPPPDLSTLINFVELQLPTLDNQLLPDGAEATVDIPFDKIQDLRITMEILLRGSPSRISFYREDGGGEGGKEDSIRSEAGEVRHGYENQDNTEEGDSTVQN